MDYRTTSRAPLLTSLRRNKGYFRKDYGHTESFVLKSLESKEFVVSVCLLLIFHGIKSSTKLQYCYCYNLDKTSNPHVGNISQFVHNFSVGLNNTVDLILKCFSRVKLHYYNEYVDKTKMKIVSGN